MKFTVELLGGKYTYVIDEKGSRALRYGEEWRDLTGDKFVYSMATEIDKLRFQKEKLLQFVEEYVEAWHDGMGGDSFLLRHAEKLIERTKKEDVQ